MIINKLKLKNYRNYLKLEIKFNTGQNIIIGNNAQGKTNIIEAIYYLAITKSFLTSNDKMIINKEYESSLIKGEIEDLTGKRELTILVNKEKKRIEINNQEIKKHSDYVGNMKVIIFSPDNVRILKEGPVNRRRFLNIELSQLYGKYVNVLNNYNCLLKQRNEYLKSIKINNNYNPIYMQIINERFVDDIITIINYRNDFIELINKYIGDIYFNIAGDKGLSIKYYPCIKIENADEMRGKLLDKINNSYERELLYGTSLIGVHREDFSFYLGDNDLSLYGSQGQVKMAILALKLAETYVFKEICGEVPILLLDDVFSELDLNKRNNLIKYLNQDMQSIITTTDINEINNEFIEKALVYKIENGNVI